MKQHGYVDFGWPETVLGICVFAVIGLIVIGIVALHQDQEQWQAFALAHHCKVTAHMDGNTNTGVAPVIGGKGGVAIVSTTSDSKTAFTCDDGVTYWKND